jgi:hypothetical protein
MTPSPPLPNLSYGGENHSQVDCPPIDMNTDVQVLGVINGSTEDEVIDVVLQRDAEGGECVQLRYRQWGSGVGWYTQKSVEIDPSQVDRLIQALNKVKRSEPRVSGDSRSVVVPFRRFA